MLIGKHDREAVFHQRPMPDFLIIPLGILGGESGIAGLNRYWPVLAIEAQSVLRQEHCSELQVHLLRCVAKLGGQRGDDAGPIVVVLAQRPGFACRPNGDFPILIAIQGSQPIFNQVGNVCQMVLLAYKVFLRCHCW